MWQRVWLGAAVALCLVSTAEAADKEGRFKIEGAGAVPCGRYLELRQARGEDYRHLLGWIDGYLTAANELTPDTFDILSWQSTDLVGALIEGFCEQNKDANVVAAVGQLVKALMPQRIRALPEVVTAESGDRKVALYKEVMREVQERLIRTGHLKGGADGIYGPGTRGALESFQKAVGLEATGLPDQRTLVALFYTEAGGGQPQQGAAPRQQGSAQPPAAASGSGAAPAQPRLNLNLGPAPQ